MQPLHLPERLRPVLSVWRLDLDLRAAPHPRDWAALDAHEQQRALRLRRADDRLRFVATRAALRRLLAAAMGLAPVALRFVAGPHGKPRLHAAPATAPLFNVAHAGAHALLALGDARAMQGVGVDLERRDAVADWTELAPVLLSPEERAATEPLPLAETWVVKEAVLKAAGLGIGQHLMDCSVHREAAGHAYRLSVPAGWPAIAAWPLPAPPGWVAAVACQGLSMPQPLTVLQDAA